VKVRLNRDFFFFQAEDGIRDGHVTGVQTCALPISGATAAAERDRNRHSSGCLSTDGSRSPARWAWLCVDRRRGRQLRSHYRRWRSEERRVGKECRSRWWLYRYKKRTKR